MSKWLRRGFGHQQHSNLAEERPHNHQHLVPLPVELPFPSPPRNEMPNPTPAYHQDTSSMAGYGSPPPNTIAMDVDDPRAAARSKYPNSVNNYNHTGSSATSKQQQQQQQQHYDQRMRDEHSGRSRSSRDRRPRHHTQQQQQPSRQSGNNNAPSSSQPHYSSSAAAPPNQTTTPTPYGKHNTLGNSTPPESVQPSFPPPAVTSESPTPEQASQRRPAYLLHRDLVIGKGSYGQVCIASRGEAEGHTSGRSGKRKKFACKCVMLRNDPKYIAKLQEEVNVLREVRGHDNVIRLYDVFCVDNELFIITELGRGGDLFHLLTTHPKHGVTESYAGMLAHDFFSPCSL
jgi:hypothetical protein